MAAYSFKHIQRLSLRQRSWRCGRVRRLEMVRCRQPALAVGLLARTAVGFQPHFFKTVVQPSSG
jgi:hypothetical protein